jgi:hypothetical protein
VGTESPSLSTSRSISVCTWFCFLPLSSLNESKLYFNFEINVEVFTEL